jgi:hypothetical protein
MNEYETYVLKDHERARRILKKFPGSIMFINIDEKLKEKEWETYIKGIQADKEIEEPRLGILSYNTDRELMRKYLLDLSVPCGYIQLKLGVKESTRIILEALKANEAKGRRKYIRVPCEDDTRATLNYKSDAGIFHADLLDISSAGVAVKSPDFAAFKPNTLLRGIQLKLRGSLVLVDGVLMGNRSDAPDVWVLLFDPKMDNAAKTGIQKYIKLSLQRYMDGLQV